MKEDEGRPFTPALKRDPESPNVDVVHRSSATGRIGSPLNAQSAMAGRSKLWRRWS